MVAAARIVFTRGFGRNLKLSSMRELNLGNCSKLAGARALRRQDIAFIHVNRPLRRIPEHPACWLPPGGVPPAKLLPLGGGCPGCIQPAYTLCTSRVDAPAVRKSLPEKRLFCHSPCNVSGWYSARGQYNDNLSLLDSFGRSDFFLERKV